MSPLDNRAHDIRALIAEFVGQGGRLEWAAFVLSSENATALALLDSDVFQLTITGGTIAGMAIAKFMAIAKLM